MESTVFNVVRGYLPEVVVLLDEVTCSDWSYLYSHP